MIHPVEYDFDALRNAWRSYLLGNAWNPKSVYGKSILESIERIADAGIHRVEHHDDSDCIPDLAVYDIRALALAYKTPGSKEYEDPKVLHSIIKKIETFYRNRYLPDMAVNAHTDWWVFEIGVPLRLLDILILLYEELPKRDLLIDRYTEAILAFRDAYKPSSRGRKESGANMCWKCHVLLLTGILRREREWIDWANEELASLLHYASPVRIPGVGKMYDDGFYPDGSYIQHYMFAYTGGYGKHLLYHFSILLYAFRKTSGLHLPDSALSFLCDRIEDTWAPLMIRGRFCDFYRGREVSRYWHQGKEVGALIIRAVLYLSEASEGKRKERLQARLKEWLSYSGMKEAVLYDYCRIAEYFVQPSLAEVMEALDRSSVKAAKPIKGHYNFGVVSKPLHHGENYSCAVSMYSKTIGMYERLGTECTRMWHISDGATYLYLSDPDAFGHNYYATADMRRVPGTTVEQSPTIETDPYYDWYLPEIRNRFGFAGGTYMGSIGSAGFCHQGQGSGKQRTLYVQKSWFFYDRELLCMGSGITSDSGNPVETILMNTRIKEDASNRLIVRSMNDNGIEETKSIILSDILGNEQDYRHVTAVLLEGNNGSSSNLSIYFFKPVNLRGIAEKRQGTWNTIKLNPDNYCENTHFSLWIPHGANPSGADYAYLLVPCEETLSSSERRLPVQILENSEAVQAVYHPKSGIRTIHFWKPSDFQGVKCSDQACIMICQQDGILHLTMTDPTKENKVISLEMPQSVQDILGADQGISATSLSPLILKVNTAGYDGAALCARFSV